MLSKIDISHNTDGSVDEIKAHGVSVHIEDMGGGEWHVLIYEGEGREQYWQFSLGDTGILVEDGTND